MSEEKLLTEPRYFCIDQKDSSYYKNKFLNNCKSRMREIDRLFQAVNSIKNKIESLYEYEVQKDPTLFDKSKEYLDSIDSKIQDVVDTLYTYKNVVAEQYQAEQCKDFEDILKTNLETIREKEKENTEV